jgi:hypothetical protein
MHRDVFVCFVFIVSSPLFFLIDPETDAAPGYDYTHDDQPLALELPGKHSPLLDHSDIAHFILSYACIRFCYCCR